MSAPLATVDLRVFDGKYALLRELHVGPTSSVYEAENLALGKRVAIKLLGRQGGGSVKAREHALSETRKASQVSHANLVDIHDLGVTPEGTPYVVMELLDGLSLEALLRERGRLPVIESCELLLQVLAALSAAHARRLVHGELNASSVVVTYPRADRPLVKVLGLCVASPREEEVSDTRTLSPDRAMFLSPEQARGEPADGRADVYSACVLLYLLLTGERPFAGPSWREVVHQIVHGEVKPLLQVNPALPKDLADVLSSGLKLNASERIGTVEELAQRLRSFASALTPASPRPSVLAQARQGITLIAAKPSAVPARGSTAPISSLRRADLASRLVTDSVLVSPRLPKPPAPPNLEVGRDFLPLLGDPERNEEIEHTAVTKASSRVRAKLSAALAILAGFAVGVLLAWLVGLI